jgi:hypothetical protein
MNIKNKSRTIVLHYHFFKNAGTSLDKILKANFVNKWITQEFSGNPVNNRLEVKKWIESNPEMICFSSHTAQLPPPQIEGVTIIPVLFIRHPIDRIASAYHFERQQNSAGFGSVLANHTNLAGYIKTRLSIKTDFQCRNYHTHRLAEVFYDTTEDKLKKAKNAIESLPFIGLVDNFELSLKKLEVLLIDNNFVNIKFNAVQENVTQSESSTLIDRLSAIEKELGSKDFKVLLENNSSDIEIYNIVSNLYNINLQPPKNK